MQSRCCIQTCALCRKGQCAQNRPKCTVTLQLLDDFSASSVVLQPPTVLGNSESELQPDLQIRFLASACLALVNSQPVYLLLLSAFGRAFEVLTTLHLLLRKPSMNPISIRCHLGTFASYSSHNVQNLIEVALYCTPCARLSRNAVLCNQPYCNG